MDEDEFRKEALKEAGQAAGLEQNEVDAQVRQAAALERMADAQEHQNADELKEAVAEKESQEHQNADALKEEKAKKESQKGDKLRKGAGFVGAALGAGAARSFSAVSSSNGSVMLFALFVIALHLMDVFAFGMSRDASTLSGMLSLYVVTGLIIAPLFLRAQDESYLGNLKRMGITYGIITLIILFLPHLLGLLPERIEANPMLQFLVLFASPWAVYLAFFDSHTSLKWLKAVYSFLLIFLILGFGITSITNSELPSYIQGESFNFHPGRAVSTITAQAMDNIKQTGARIIGLGGALNTAISRNINDSIGVTYQSRVDSYSSRDLGVRFEKLSPNQQVYYPGQDVVVWADVVGEALEDPIELSIICYALSNKNIKIDGVIGVQEGLDPGRMVFTNLDVRSLSCTIPDLAPGSYSVVFAGTFYFETWSYMKYYFSPVQTVNEYRGRDIVSEAGLDRQELAEQNYGPVSVGMTTYENVFAVNVTNPVIGARLGASVSNAWPGGLNAVRSFELLVSPPFMLSNCDKPTKMVEGKQYGGKEFYVDEFGFNHYVFVDINNPETYRSVTCSLQFERPQDAAAMMSNFKVVQRTFGAIVKYTYSIEEKTRVVVDDGVA